MLFAGKVVLVTGVGGLNDKRFDALAFKGLQRGAAELGATTEVMESKSSEDFIPNLRPAVRRSAIDKAIAEIKELKGATLIRRDRYDAALDFLDEHRFYLRKEDCDTIISVIEFVEAALRKQARAEIWIIREKFVPNTQLDEELYYQKE